MLSRFRFLTRAPHLASAGLALLLGIGLFAVATRVFHIRERLADYTASEVLEVKDQGITLQAEAFRNKHLLPVYGTSELLNESRFSGRLFFSNAPTGFEMFSIGKSGGESLIIAERLAALGAAAKDKKVVIILSPTWFLARSEGHLVYNGNFSAIQARLLAFDSPISPALKSEFANAMLKEPASLADYPILRLELERLAKKGSDEELLDWTGRVEDRALLLGDNLTSIFALTGAFLEHPRQVFSAGAPRRTKEDWDILQKTAEDSYGKNTYVTILRDGPQTDAEHIERVEGIFKYFQFPQLLERSSQWKDLAILLQTLKELQMKPLFISLPINGVAFGKVGVTPEMRAMYYDKLQKAIEPSGFPLATMPHLDEDPTMFEDSIGHPSAKGWVVLDEVISDFYHGKLANLAHSPVRLVN